MDTPVLHRVDSSSNKDDAKAIVFVPGICTEDKSIENAGWDGEIHQLWWDSSHVETLLDKELPEIYGKKLFTEKSDVIFQHVYESYGAGKSIYGFA